MKHISTLDGPLGHVEDTPGIIKIDVEYYKVLFSREESLDLELSDGFGDEADRVSPEQNNILDAPFTEAEVKEAAFGSYAEGAPGPDGFSFLFYQKFWGSD